MLRFIRSYCFPYVMRLFYFQYIHKKNCQRIKKTTFRHYELSKCISSPSQAAPKHCQARFMHLEKLSLTFSGSSCFKSCLSYLNHPCSFMGIFIISLVFLLFSKLIFSGFCSSPSAGIIDTHGSRSIL